MKHKSKTQPPAAYLAAVSKMRQSMLANLFASYGYIPVMLGRGLTSHDIEMAYRMAAEMAKPKTN